MHEIKIYGEIVPFEEDWIINQGGYCNLSDLQRQLTEADGSDIKVRIRSFGGDVETGFSMYAELRRYAKDNNAKVQTFGEGQVASIATVIFLAGDERILTEHTEPFVHNAWSYVMGDNQTLSRAAADLEKCNIKIAEHYALHTDLTFEEGLELMKNETSITTEEAKAMRFATSIEEVFRPVALKRFNNKLNIDMNKNPKTKGILAKLEAFLNLASGAQNKLVMTADELELDFYELSDDDVIEVGAKAYYDGKDAEGKYVMKTGETYVFEAGVLTEILEAESDELSEDAVALQAEIDTLTEKLETITNKAVELDAANKKQATIIANYKNILSAQSTDDGGEKGKQGKQPTAESKSAKAVANFNKFKQK